MNQLANNNLTKRIILVDDHTLVRRGLAALIRSEGSYQVVAEAENGEEALRRADETAADIVILDLAMPRLNGLETARRLSLRQPAMKVLVLSMYEDESFVLQALQAGASGYILKRSMEDELFQALEAVTSGKIFVSATIPGSVIEKYRQGDETITADLTRREHEILQLIVEGHTSNNIGEILSISPHTVSRHRANLMQKLAVHNQVELVRLAIERRLVIIKQRPSALSRRK